MIVVTGATGAPGAAIVDHLLKLVPAFELAASVRDVKQAAAPVDPFLRELLGRPLRTVEEVIKDGKSEI